MYQEIKSSCEQQCSVPSSTRLKSTTRQVQMGQTDLSELCVFAIFTLPWATCIYSLHSHAIHRNTVITPFPDSLYFSLVPLPLFFAHIAKAGRHHVTHSVHYRIYHHVHHHSSASPRASKAMAFEDISYTTHNQTVYLKADEPPPFYRSIRYWIVLSIEGELLATLQRPIRISRAFRTTSRLFRYSTTHIVDSLSLFFS
jgi:hypothetical protein